MPTIDDTLLIPVLSEGDKLYHYTSAAGMQGIPDGGAKRFPFETIDELMGEYLGN